MPQLHPAAQTLVAIVDNQAARTVAALRGLREDVFTASPGGQTRSIFAIGRHLLSLRKMQLNILGSPLVGQMPDADSISSIGQLRRALASGAKLLKQAILEYNPANWCRKPLRPRKGVWGDQPTIVRLTRPLNDFTSHLGDIRTIRSIFGNPVRRER